MRTFRADATYIRHAECQRPIALNAYTRVEAWLDAKGNILDQRYTVLEVRDIVPTADPTALPFTDEKDLTEGDVP